MIRKIFSSQLRINMVSGVAVTLVNIAVLAVAYPMYLHFLGYEQYGVWLVLSTVLTFAQLGNLGIGQAVMKLVAEEYGRGDLEVAQQYMASAIAILAISGAVVLAAILLFKGSIVGVFKLSSDNAATALWLLPYIGALSVYAMIVQAVNATLSGLGRMDLANYIQTGGRLLSVCVSVPLLHSGWKIGSLLIGTCICYLLVHVASMFCVARILKVRCFLPLHFTIGRARRLITFGSAVFGSSVANVVLGVFNKVVLSRFAGVSAVPIYDIAFNGAVQIRALIESILRPFMPEISRLSGNGTLAGAERIRNLNSRAMRLIVGVGLPFYLVLLASAAVLLRLWLGGRFNVDITPAFRLMLVVTFVTLIGVPAYQTLLGMGWAREAMIASSIITGGNCALVMATILFGGTPSVVSISSGLILVSSVSAFYLITKASKEIERCRYQHTVEMSA